VWGQSILAKGTLWKVENLGLGIPAFGQSLRDNLHNRDLQVRIPNIEIRNKFKYRMFQCPKQTRINKMQVLMFRSFESWSFYIVSNFGFRASDFERFIGKGEANNF
jgi:hypothetical protein